MKKLIFILSITILAILASCNDSNQGVLQKAHNASAKERPISSYLGFYLSSSDVPVPIVMRDGDVYRATICTDQTDNPLTSDIHEEPGLVLYTKILDITNQASGQRDFPFMVWNNNLYMAHKGSDDIFSFYYVKILEDRELGTSDLSEAREKNKVTIYTTSDNNSESLTNIVEFNASNNASGKVQILYKVKGERRSDCTDEHGNLVGNEWKQRHYGVINWNEISSSEPTKLTLTNEAMVPTNAIIIGDGVLKVTTDDPEIEELEDDLNDLYVMRNGEMRKVRTGTTYSNFPLGSDGAYALLADGKIYSINYNYNDENEYTATLTNNDAFTFDVYKREGNYVPFFRDEGYMYDETGAQIGTQKHHIVGYISGNGIYWVEDFTDDTLSDQSKAIPKLLGISNDNDIIPIAFIGTGTRTIDGEPHPEYLIVTQNNGFYVLQPTQGDNNRGKMEKVDPDADYTSFDNFEFIGATN